MANRNWVSGGKIFSMHVSPVMLDASITIGASGAVTATIGSTIASASRTSIGLYRINFQDNYSGLYAAMGSVQSPVSGLSGVSTVEIQNAPNAAVSLLSNPGISIKTLDAAGALVDPASGSVVNVIIYLSNSSVKVGGE